jgi:hypothetical protein
VLEAEPSLQLDNIRADSIRGRVVKLWVVA